MSQPAVETQLLTRRFGSFTAVDKVTLSISAGETFGFLGANGAGKTTTIRMLCGLLLPTEGEGMVAGLDVFSQSEQIKRSIGYMSQKFSLYSDLTGRENLNFYGAAYGLSRSHTRERINDLSDRLELAEFLDRPSKSLPTGWRQRLALGAALLHEPRILFLDEPTGGVDPIFRRKFWSLLYDLAEEEVTIFVTTHYMDEAEYCDRISIMHQGRIVEMGKPFEIVAAHDEANLEDTFISLISGRENVDA
ncbi:MAG: ATP-binding cassette domain-containing protein [candidate division Zixibacteria bacterium]|nr:ATP-binding cassette domain-containing protein [candidate division Zixibacteria bacterium]